MDEGHKKTDKILKDLEKGLKEVYGESYKTVSTKLEEVKGLIEELNNESDPVKRLVLMRREERLTTLADNIARDIRKVNVEATKMINGEMLNVYEENINWGHYFLEQEGGYVLNYDLYNKNIIKKLYADNENPFTKIALNNIKDKSRIYRDLRRHFSSAIRNGETIEEIAKRVRTVVNRNHYGSVRIARTETTRLESIGRQESFKQGEELGLILKKVWIGTNDKRTRESHLMLNGKTIDMDKRFSNGLLYPGEHGGRAEEVINCRCTHIAEIKGSKKSAKLQEVEEKYKNESFEDWKKRRGTREEVKKAINKDGKEIIFELDKMNDKNKKIVVDTLTDLSEKYNTRLFKVTNEKQVTKGEKGHVGLDFKMNLSTSKPSTVVHEFAHSLAIEKADKLGLTNDQEFWKEIKKLRTQYHKDIKEGKTKEISDYSLTNVEEFFAEAFTHYHLKDTELLEWNYGKDYTYTNKVVAIIDKYFKKR